MVTVQDTDGTPEAGLHVYAFSGTTYTNYNGVSDASGQVVLTLPQGEYRFRADKPAPGSSGNGTQFWSAAENDCAVPGCVSAMVETTIPVTVTVLDSGGAPQAGLPVYAFDGTTYTNFNASTDADGRAVMTLPQGGYRFRADKEGVQYWSGETNHCTIPGCLNAAITVPGGGASLITTTITYSYDGLNRLTAADYDSGEYFYYTYDDVGNRLTEEKKTTPDGLVENTAYTYDDANRMTSAGGVMYTWDDKGNLLDDGVNTYTYNHANKLTMVDGQSSIVSFTYNGLGDRLSESIDGLSIVFTLDLNTGLTQVLADDSHVYLYGLGRIAQTAPSEYVYFLGDALGSVRQLTDGQGIVILARAYEPYGSVLRTAGEDATKYGFTGEWQENGLVFLRARYYSDVAGRFLSRDAWEGDKKHPLSYNDYAYGFDNPMFFTDPIGLWPSYCFMMPAEYMKFTPGCPGYDELHTPPEVEYYDERQIPHNITFNDSPADLMPPKMLEDLDWDGRFESKPAGVPGWQYTQGMSGLCGQISIASILNTMIEAGVSVNDVINMWKAWNKITKNLEDDIEYTDENQLATFINVMYKDVAHAWNGSDGWLGANAWGGETAVMEHLKWEWFSQGTYVITGIYIDPLIRNEEWNPIDPQHGGHLIGGVSKNHGSTCTKYNFFTNTEEEVPCKGAYHWVVVTGVSDQWGWEQNLESQWKWVRIFNPFQGQTEYYWWYDFTNSWTGSMVRVDPADADDTCTITGWYCTR